MSASTPFTSIAKPIKMAQYIHNVFNTLVQHHEAHVEKNARLPACHWTPEKFPDVFDDEDEDDLPPMINLTTPEGETFYPTDFKNYARRNDSATL
ncbi:hypothetical protein NKR23_g346 [Pleurostoma richardsiae]|uniref:Uncharacterized protein n=1 Tax=Pleurostoma richardsiae TaxID=41990 RepID=A0AA38RV50_9PEZI|nr:hypothetical protein NKR23_g346 [Pleurostoma richardsiae]